MAAQRLFHRIQRAGEHRRLPQRGALAVEPLATQTGQYRQITADVIAVLLREHLRRAKRQHRQQCGIQVTAGQIAHPCRHLTRHIGRTHRRQRRLQHHRSGPPARRHQTGVAQSGVSAGDGIRIDLQLRRQLAYRRQQLTWPQRAVFDACGDLLGNLDSAAAFCIQ